MLNTWKLSKEKSCETIFKNQARERVDYEQINGFIFHKMGIKYDRDKSRYRNCVFDGEQQQLMAYKQLFNGNFFDINYSLPKHKWGRVHPQGSCSISLFHRPTRHGLCIDKYTDIDMVCCQPRIICEIAKLNNLQLPMWEAYIKDPKKLRSAISKFHKVDVSTAKTLLLRICFGGEYGSWLVDEGIQDQTHLCKEVVDMEKEIMFVIDKVYEHNPQIAKDVKKCLGNTEYQNKYPQEIDKKRNVMGLWCQTIERFCQESAVSWLCVNKGFVINDIVPCQDGFMILKHLYYEGIIQDCKNAVMAKMGFEVDFLVKPFDEAIEIPKTCSHLFDTITRAVRSEEEVAEILLHKFRNVLKYSNGQLYLKRDYIWIQDEDTIKKFLLEYIQACDFYTPVVGDKLKKKPFSKRTSTAKLILESLLWKINVYSTDEQLYNKFHTTTVGKLCFQDGVLDFINKRFYTWIELDSEKIEYFTTVMIRRDFKTIFENRDTIDWNNQIEEVKTKVIQPMFMENTDNVIEVFARGIAGCYYDKKWVKFTGNRNCGKGSFGNGLIKNAIEDYYFSVQGQNFVRQKFNQGESAKTTMWMLPAQFSRVAIIQEFPKFGKDTAIDGNIIKGWCSGGDEHTTRQLYKNTPTKFKLQSLLAFFANDFPTIEPADALETCHSYHTIKTYVSQSVYDAEQLKDQPQVLKDKFVVGDDTIKYNCEHSVDWANAFILLLFKQFPDQSALFTSRCGIEDEGESNVESFILEHFEIGHPDVFIRNNRIRDFINDSPFRELSRDKLAISLRALGCMPAKSNGERGWKGLKEIEYEVEDEEIIN